MSLSPALQCQNIRKSFPSGDLDIEVLKGINVDIYSGQLTMLVGPSGCGKTTLLSIISGILSPTKGDIILFEENVFKLKDKERAEFRLQNIGFIFQQFNLLPALTAAENVAVPLISANYPFEDALKEARIVLGRMGMGDHSEKIPSHLSGGQQQRVAIGRALIHRPKLIVCDEPTSALDEHTGLGIMDLLKEISQDKEKSVIVVTHDHRIFSYAERILHMSDGQIVKEESAK